VAAAILFMSVALFTGDDRAEVTAAVLLPIASVVMLLRAAVEK